MTDSPILAHGELKQEDPEIGNTQKRLCDFCGESIALLYCGADSAKLCLSCDREVHSTNQLFTKHTRLLLCDACDSSPSSIFCSTHNSVFCQNCDWENHNLSSSSLHDRRPLEGFIGCPNVTELLANFGFEDLSKKALFGGDGFVGDGFYGSESDDGFSDLFVWNTPSVVSLDDLIVSGGSERNFQAMGVPPLPKNRNATCGQHKEEILCQLRQMAKLEPNSNDDQGDAEHLIGFQSLVPKHKLQLGDTRAGFEHKAEPDSYEANAFQWCSETGEVTNQVLPSTLLGSYIETSCLVPDNDSDTGHSLNQTNGGHEGQSQHPVITETFQVFPKVAGRELTSQERDSAISRYKEKKKSRRYDKHIRYESRKVRAESRTRIRGRFAKVDH